MAANSTVTIFGKIPPKYINQVPNNSRNYVYGLNYPLGKNKKVGGFFSKEVGINLIKGAVKQLLQTERGERLMLPNFGCNLRKFLFQPLDSYLFEQIKEEIKYSFYNYIVGAQLIKIGVFPTEEPGPAGGNSLLVVLSLKLDSDELSIFDVEVKIS